jgi:hypothetical protein
MNPSTAPRSVASLLAVLGFLSALCALAPRACGADSRREQSISFPEIRPHTVGDAPFSLSASASSGLDVVLEVVAGPASLSGGKLTLTGGTGIVIVRASQGGDSDFQPAIAERAFAVNPPPSAPLIVSEPASAVASVGEAVVLRVQVSGVPEPALQWRKDGIPVEGSVGPELVIAAAAVADSGSYDVVAANASGRAVSTAARVSVGKRRQLISFQAPAATPSAGQPVTLNASASSGLPVQFTVVSGAATVSGSTLTAGAGTVVVAAAQAGDADYDPAEPVLQTMVFSADPLQH